MGLTSVLPGPTTIRLWDLLARLDDDGLSISVAESCTGGLVAAAFSGAEGLSHVFTSGFVTYSDDAKRRILGVPDAVLNSEGAVSKACAVALAEGALSRSEADLALAITGFAGPAGPDDEEGLVYFALARSGFCTVTREEHFGLIGRDPVRLACLHSGLDLIEAALANPASADAKTVLAG